MNILKLSTLDNRGGAAIVAWNLFRELNKRGLNCDMFVKHKLSTSDKVCKARINYFQNKISEVFSNDIDFGARSEIINSKQYKKADIVHCHNLHGSFVNLDILREISTDKPIVWTLHDMWSITGHCAHSLDCNKYETGCKNCPYLQTPPSLSWDNTAYLWKKKKYIYQKSKINLVAPSNWLKNKLSKSILSQFPVSVIYNGIDVGIFKKQNKLSLRKKLNLPQDKKIICFSANGGKENFWKGGKYIDQVINHISDKNVIFLNIGGNEISKEKNTINTGYIADNTSLSEYYGASDLFLFSSIAENFPLAILEAMSCGLPIVTFNVGGIPEVVRDIENGRLIKSQDTNALIQGVNSILKLSQAAIDTISAANSDRIKKNFSIDKMTDQYISLYKSLI